LQGWGIFLEVCNGGQGAGRPTLQGEVLGFRKYKNRRRKAGGNYGEQEILGSIKLTDTW